MVRVPTIPLNPKGFPASGKGFTVIFTGLLLQSTRTSREFPEKVIKDTSTTTPHSRLAEQDNTTFVRLYRLTSQGMLREKNPFFVIQAHPIHIFSRYIPHVPNESGESSRLLSGIRQKAGSSSPAHQPDLPGHILLTWQSNSLPRKACYGSLPFAETNHHP